jgi:hypothetical protein
MGWPKFEVRYQIDGVGCWNIIGGRDYTSDGVCMLYDSDGSDNHDLLVEYDKRFAATMIYNHRWKKNFKGESFHYMVDGVVMLEEEGPKDIESEHLIQDNKNVTNMDIKSKKDNE